MKLKAVTMQRKTKERIIQRGISWWCRARYPLGWGYQGGDHCCCGNYVGCCVYANLVCCAQVWVVLWLAMSVKSWMLIVRMLSFFVKF